jgi:hypothetical protein
VAPAVCERHEPACAANAVVAECTCKVFARVHLIPPAALATVLAAVAQKGNVENGAAAVAVRRLYQIAHHDRPCRLEIGGRSEGKDCVHLKEGRIDM